MPIENEERFRQLLSFEGIERLRKIRPTDIDAMIDYNGKVFIFIEAKLINVDVRTGQRIALENLVRCGMNAGVFAVSMICVHDTPVSEIALLRNMKVSEYFMVTEKEAEGKWFTPTDEITVIKAIESIEILAIHKGIEI